MCDVSASQAALVLFDFLESGSSYVGQVLRTGSWGRAGMPILQETTSLQLPILIRGNVGWDWITLGAIRETIRVLRPVRRLRD
jgi:hypothetical protein